MMNIKIKHRVAMHIPSKIRLERILTHEVRPKGENQGRFSFILHPPSSILNELFSSKKNILLFFVILCSLFLFLGAKSLWTQEWRWIDISIAMMNRHDFLHPFLAGTPYYDKPLLSYWFIIPLLKTLPHHPITAIRIPSAIAGLAVIWATYQLSKLLFNRKTAVITAWMFVSTYFFIFWARTSSVDMLNLAGIMIALLYYFKHRDNPRFIHYFLFFLILALASLLKGLIAAAIVILVLIPEILLNAQWKKLLNFKCLSALILGAVFYIIPFFLSSHFNPMHYQESGLYLVFQENVLRFFKPFDHTGSFYTYFIYLPLYTFPWILFFIPGMVLLLKKWRKIDNNTRWLMYANFIIFLFLTASGSRRSYYIIPMIPFVLMLTAQWINLVQNKKIERIATQVALLFASAIIFINVIIIPMSLLGGGATVFANDIKKIATQIQPWENWSLALTDVDTCEAYYLSPHPLMTYIDRNSLNQHLGTKTSNIIYLLPSQEVLKIIPPETLKNYTVIIEKPMLYQKYLTKNHTFAVALIPES